MPAAVKKRTTEEAPASNGKKKVTKKKASKPEQKLVYPDFDVTLFAADTDDGYMTVAKAKELVGWSDELEKGEEPLFYDLYDKPIVCRNNLSNRPFYMNVATDWKLEILHRKWKGKNGETFVIDRTGMVQDGQHRWCGLILAGQEIELHPEKWREYWTEEPYIEALVVTGVDEADETVNTIGVSKPRNRTDVVYRSEFFADVHSRKERKHLSSITGYCVKTLWERTAANIGPFRLVAKRSHSSFLDFIARHPRILECVRTIANLDKSERSISRYVPLGMASGMLYLMGACHSDQEAYDKVNSEEAVSWEAWGKAVEFWENLAVRDKGMKALAERLLGMDSTGVIGSGEKMGTLCKAWNLFIEDQPITEDDIQILITTDEYDMPVLAENPIVGGIDVGKHDDIDEEDE